MLITDSVVTPEGATITFASEIDVELSAAPSASVSEGVSALAFILPPGTEGVSVTVKDLDRTFDESPLDGDQVPSGRQLFVIHFATPTDVTELVV